MKKIFLAVSMVVVAGLLSGCGYTTRSLLPSQYQRIYVEPVDNKIDYMNQSERKIYLPGLETRVRASLIDRYLLDGNLKIGKEDLSDLVLKVQLLAFEREELRLTANEDVKEYRLRITVSLELEDRAEKEILWSEPSFSGEATYYTTGTLARSESAAVEDALKDLAMRVVARTIEDW